MKEYVSVAEFADKYGAFILDVWGVIHDGENLYPGVIESLKKLKAAGKEIVFLSNAPRRSDKVKKALAKFGIAQDLYKDAISSGEVAYQYFAKNQKPEAIPYFYIGPEKDSDLLAGLNYRAVAKAKDAKFALAAGFDEDDSTLDEKMPQIKEAMANNLKMYCVNPDLIVVRQNGTKMLCAGVIGEYYRDHGGETEFIGKPYKAIYDQALKVFSTAIPKSHIAMIGDALATDIKGANNIGIDSILVLGGILETEKDSLEILIKRSGVKPTATLPRFIW